MADAGHLAPVMIPVIFGLIVTAMVYTLGHISGAHFNPAVTFAFALGRHFPLEETIAYSLAQIAGATLGATLLAVIFPDAQTFGGTVPHIPEMSAVAFEIVLAFVLMMVVMAVATDTRAVGTMAGVAVGAVIIVAAYVAGWATGASMNPARTLGPMIVEGNFTSLWIYVVGPYAGATLGAFVYKFIAKEAA